MSKPLQRPSALGFRIHYSAEEQDAGGVAVADQEEEGMVGAEDGGFAGAERGQLHCYARRGGGFGALLVDVT